jgi:hypothetical protein
MAAYLRPTNPNGVLSPEVVPNNKVKPVSSEANDEIQFALPEDWNMHMLASIERHGKWWLNVRASL